MTEAQRQKPRINQKDIQTLQKGDLITYLLPPSALPVNPLREWHGRVEFLANDMVNVTSLDEGYEGETEYVRKADILFIQKGEEG